VDDQANMRLPSRTDRPIPGTADRRGRPAGRCRPRQLPRDVGAAHDHRPGCMDGSNVPPSEAAVPDATITRLSQLLPHLDRW